MMAALSARSEAALARLRAYVPPPTTWYSLPLSRRAAVLILLFADRKGDLRVVLTMRASTLSSYAGQAALPGGKSDTLVESPIHTARREASEEIGLPEPAQLPNQVPIMTSLVDSKGNPTTEQPQTAVLKATPHTPGLPPPFSIEHLTELPTNLARTELGVRPVVAFLSTADRSKTSSSSNDPTSADVEQTLIPRLDAKEVAAVFSAPLHNFLTVTDELPIGSLSLPDSERWLREHAGPANNQQWYHGQWIDWHERRWRMHNFYVPVAGQVVTWPRNTKPQAAIAPKPKPAATAAAIPSKPVPPARRLRSIAKAASKTLTAATGGPRRPRPSANLPYRDYPLPSDPDSLQNQARYRVFGMTARILLDCARVAYGEEPNFEHNSHFGDEEMIAALLRGGRLVGEKRRGDEFKSEELDKAARDVAARGEKGAWAFKQSEEEKGKGKEKL